MWIQSWMLQFVPSLHHRPPALTQGRWSGIRSAVVSSPAAGRRQSQMAAQMMARVREAEKANYRRGDDKGDQEFHGVMFLAAATAVAGRRQSHHIQQPMTRRGVCNERGDDNSSHDPDK
jgi:hypothetical protein